MKKLIVSSALLFLALSGYAHADARTELPALKAYTDFLAGGAKRECHGNQECVVTKGRELSRRTHAERYPNEEKFCQNGNCINGQGIYLYPGGYYEGMFKDGHYTGKGVRVLNGTRYEGMFKDDKENGEGIFTYKEGHYEGMFKDGTSNGFGKLFDKKGTLLYSGEWVNGKPVNPPSSSTSSSSSARATNAPPIIISDETSSTFGIRTIKGDCLGHAFVLSMHVGSTDSFPWTGTSQVRSDFGRTAEEVINKICK